jgi:O-antigen/teichoic acid export membrane protein
MGGIVGGAVFGGLILEAVPIVDLWTGRQPQLTIDVLRIYAAAFILVTPVQLLVIALIAAGRHGLIGAIVLGNSVVNLCLSAILAVLIGPVGVAIGTLVVVSFDNGIVIPYVAARRLGFSHRTIYGAVALGIGIGLLIVGSSQLIPVEGVAGLAVRVAWCGLLTAAALALAWRGQVLGHSLEATAAGRA